MFQEFEFQEIVSKPHLVVNFSIAESHFDFFCIFSGMPDLILLSKPKKYFRVNKFAQELYKRNPVFLFFLSHF